MQSIKKINNNSLKWRNVDVDCDKIITRDFSTLNNSVHYKFISNFFEGGEDRARKTEEYAKLEINSHFELFQNVPKNLDIHPQWWLMPWGGVVRQPKFDIESRIKMKKIYTDRFILLLQSVEKNGFRLDGFQPPVHKLSNSTDSCYILQDGHHRSAIFSYLKINNANLIMKTEDDKPKLRLSVKPILLVQRRHIPRMQLCSCNNKKGHFTLTDAYKWFDLPFELLKLSTHSNKKSTKILAGVYDKLMSELK